MPKRPRSHQLDEAGRRAVRAALPVAWVVRDVNPDYGLDLSAEIFDNTNEATGLTFGIQVKATDAPLPEALALSGLTVDSLAYWLDLDSPTLLARYHAPSDTIYARWVHTLDAARSGTGGSRTFTVRFDDGDIWPSEQLSEILEACLAHRRERRWAGSASDAPAPSMPSPLDEVSPHLEDLLHAELGRQLRWPNVVRAHAPLNHLVALAQDPFLRALIPRDEWIESFLEVERDPSYRFGLLNARERRSLIEATYESPISVAVSPALLGAVAILVYLRDAPHLRLGIDLDFGFTHAADLVVALDRLDPPPDALALLLPPAHELLGRRSTPYRPLALLPAQSYRVIGCAGGHDGSGDLYAPLEGVTGASLQLKRLGDRLGHPMEDGVDDIHPSDALDLLNEAGAAGEPTRFLMWNPHWSLAAHLSLGEVTTDITARDGWEDALLMVGPSFHERTAELFQRAVRGAWLDLLEHEDRRRLAVDLMLADESYMTAFNRMAGLTALLFESGS